MKMRIAMYSSVVFASAVACLSCSNTLWGSRGNSHDPGAANYQGYPTVTSSSQIAAVTPSSGQTVDATKLTITEVAGATAYELVVATSPSLLNSSPLYDNANFSSNVLNIGSIPMTYSTTYYWMARAKIGNAWDNNWSPVFSFTTSSTWPWKKRIPIINNSWVSISSSADGSRLVAVGGDKEYSIDGGNTWNDFPVTGISAYWRASAVSADGSHMAISTEEFCVISQDSGNSSTLTRLPVDMADAGSCIAMNSNGSYLILGGLDIIVASSDMGSSWNLKEEHVHLWTAVASSSDGTHLVACESQGGIWTSKDSGATWAEIPGTDPQYWSGVASNSDGTRLAACVSGGYIWTSSDSGATWESHTNYGTGSWSSIASSSDGTRLSACSYGYIWTSADSGVTWTAQYGAGSQDWSSIASDSTGTCLAACVENGTIWTGTIP